MIITPNEQQEMVEAHINSGATATETKAFISGMNAMWEIVSKKLKAEQEIFKHHLELAKHTRK